MTETLALHFHILVPFKKNLILIRCPLIISSFRLKLRKKAFNLLYFAQSILFFTPNVSYSNMMKTKNKNQISALYFTDTTVKKFTCINYKGRMRNQLPYKIMIL